MIMPNKAYDIRTYRLEEQVALLEAEDKRQNKRIDALEDDKK